MRTEIKIAVVVGLVIIASTVVYFVNRSGSAPPTQVLPMDAPAQRVTGAPKTTGPNTPALAQRKPVTPAIPPTGTPARPPGGPMPSGPNTPLRGAPGQQQAADANAIKVAPPTLTAVTPGPGGTAEPNAGRLSPPVSTPPLTRPTPGGDAEPNLPPLVGAIGQEPSDRAPKVPTEVAGEPGATGVSPPLRSEITAPAVPPIGPNAPRAASPGPNTPQPLAPPGGMSNNQPAAGGVRHTVAQGESLWTIAEDYFGDPYQWVKIKAANPGLDPDSLAAGQVIILPPKQQPSPPAQPPSRDPNVRPAEPRDRAPSGAAPSGATGNTEAAGARPPPSRTYVVAENDTLISIARRNLGNASAWRQILELNRDKLSRPEDLKVGMVLRLPERANGTRTAPTQPQRSSPAKANERR